MVNRHAALLIGQKGESVVSNYLANLNDTITIHPFLTISDVIKVSRTRNIIFDRIVFSSKALEDMGNPDAVFQELSSFLYSFSSSTSLVFVTKEDSPKLNEKFQSIFKAPMYVLAYLKSPTVTDLSKFLIDPVDKLKIDYAPSGSNMQPIVQPAKAEASKPEKKGLFGGLFGKKKGKNAQEPIENTQPKVEVQQEFQQLEGQQSTMGQFPPQAPSLITSPVNNLQVNQMQGAGISLGGLSSLHADTGYMDGDIASAFSIEIPQMGSSQRPSIEQLQSQLLQNTMGQAHLNAGIQPQFGIQQSPQILGNPIGEQSQIQQMGMQAQQTGTPQINEIQPVQEVLNSASDLVQQSIHQVQNNLNVQPVVETAQQEPIGVFNKPLIVPKKQEVLEEVTSELSLEQAPAQQETKKEFINKKRLLIGSNNDLTKDYFKNVIDLDRTYKPIKGIAPLDIFDHSINGLKIAEYGGMTLMTEGYSNEDFNLRNKLSYLIENSESIIVNCPLECLDGIKHTINLYDEIIIQDNGDLDFYLKIDDENIVENGTLLTLMQSSFQSILQHSELLCARKVW